MKTVFCSKQQSSVQSTLQVRYLECVDVMLRQLMRRLHEAEAAGHGRFAICVTGDHSTPVLFGDHSHEPVPFTIAHVRHMVGFQHTMNLSAF